MAKKNKSRFTSNSIIGEGTPFSVIEAFKATRTNLMFMLDSKSDKNSIVFTSFAPRDGKTTTCLNLAITFAQTGAKIPRYRCRYEKARYSPLYENSVKTRTFRLSCRFFGYYSEYI